MESNHQQFRDETAEASEPIRPRCGSESAKTKKSRLKGLREDSDKLRHGRKDIKAEKPHRSTHLSSEVLSSRLHSRIEAADQDDNAGTQAMNRGTETAEAGAHAARNTVDRARYSKKLKEYKQESRLHMDEPAAESISPGKTEKSTAGSNSSFLSRWQQRNAIKKEYAAARTGKIAASSAASSEKSAEKAAKEVKSLAGKAGEFVSGHSGAFVFSGILLVLCLFIAGTFSSCSMAVQGGETAILGSSYTAEDADIINANNDYKAMEANLQGQIDSVKSAYPGYDEYQYELANINHNPYVLTSYLTVLYEDYTRAEVQQKLKDLFSQQYQLTFREEVQERTRTETRTGYRSVQDEETGEWYEEEYEYEVEVKYTYRILYVKLVNSTLENVIEDSGLNSDQLARYHLLNETRGNRAYLFADDIYSNPSAGEYTDYEIPGEALTDEKFASMMQEAEKYLGYPYVWGGSSPSTSFDCSGFVCWVINHCGNGWNVGRTTAEGLRKMLSIIPAAEAQPGDIIFFQGTYNTAGASHVGIYVGNGMMLHCGSPIQFSNINSAYWQQHFYCFGRIN